MKRNGFTLIEMLVVCLIIVLLAALVFRMTGVLGRSDKASNTHARLEMVANALEEFKAIYGKYPPVPLYKTSERGLEPVIYYEYPMPDTWGATLAEQRENARRMIREGRGKRSQWSDEEGKEGTVFTFGLCSFFVPRVNGTASQGGLAFLESPQQMPEQWSAFNTGNESGDTQRDLDAVRRILPYLDTYLTPQGTLPGIEENQWGGRNCGLLNLPWPGPKHGYTNFCVTINDAWDRPLHYYSIPPYETYKLWSGGEDGLTSGDKCRNKKHGAAVHKGERGTDWGGEYFRILDGEPETLDDILVGSAKH